MLTDLHGSVFPDKLHTRGVLGDPDYFEVSLLPLAATDRDDVLVFVLQPAVDKSRQELGDERLGTFEPQFPCRFNDGILF
jgi:hypothetical protein